MSIQALFEGEEAEAKVEHVTFELRVLTSAQGNEMKHPEMLEQLIIRTAEYVAKVVFFFFLKGALLLLDPLQNLMGSILGRDPS